MPPAAAVPAVAVPSPARTTFQFVDGDGPSLLEACWSVVHDSPLIKALPFLPCPPDLQGYSGNREFDPLWLSSTTPMDWMREAELKHGRVCMLATLGWVSVDLGFRFPKPEFQGVMSMDAHNVGVESGLMTVLFAAIFVVEFLGVVRRR